MELVNSSLPCLAIGLLFALSRREGRMLLLSLSLAFGTLAVVLLPAAGGATLLLTDGLLLLGLALTLLTPSGARRAFPAFGPGRAGRVLLVLLLLATLLTLFAPRLFEGSIEVFQVGREVNQRGVGQSPLAPNSGNLTQLLRLTLTVLFFALTTSLLSGPRGSTVAFRAVLALTLAHAALGLVDLLTHHINRPDLMALLRTASYALATDQVLEGVKRMAGGMPEASAYGYVATGLFGFWAHLATGRRYRGIALGLAALSLWMALRSTSASAAFGVGTTLLLLLVQRLGEGRWHRASLARATATLALLLGLPALLAIAALTYSLSPEFAQVLDRAFLDKLGTPSAAERGSWNRAAWEALIASNGAGLGLGSVRASSWPIATLATLGLAGFLLFATFIARLLTFRPGPGAAAEVREVAAAARFALLALLLRALVSKTTPNLDYIFFLFAGIATALALADLAPRARAQETRTLTGRPAPAGGPLTPS